jgi:hypothetical protein
MNKLGVLGFFVFSIFFGKDALAQLDHTHAAGLRFGGATGLSYRYSLSEDRAVEGILNLQSTSAASRFRVVGLYEYHKPLAENFSWYYGFGGSLGSVRYKAYKKADGTQVVSSSDMMLSVDAIIGVSYDIPSSPLEISLDAKPYLDFLQESSIRWVDPFGFTVRYKF